MSLSSQIFQWVLKNNSWLKNQLLFFSIYRKTYRQVSKCTLSYVRVWSLISFSAAEASLAGFGQRVSFTEKWRELKAYKHGKKN